MSNAKGIVEELLQVILVKINIFLAYSFLLHVIFNRRFSSDGVQVYSIRKIYCSILAQLNLACVRSYHSKLLYSLRNLLLIYLGNDYLGFNLISTSFFEMHTTTISCINQLL